MPLEAFLFGVLLPIALMGYFLSGTSAVEEEVDTKVWLEARCTPHHVVLEPQLIYHHGKFQDAKNKAYQEGRMWQLEPTWNTTVRLVEPMPFRWQQREWMPSWDAITRTTATVADRPHCVGQVLESLDEVRQYCLPLERWVPKRYWLHNRVKDWECWVDRDERSEVYLDVAKPLYFYTDEVAVVVFAVIGLTFACFIAFQHRQAIARWIPDGLHVKVGTCVCTCNDPFEDEHGLPPEDRLLGLAGLGSFPRGSYGGLQSPGREVIDADRAADRTNHKALGPPAALVSKQATSTELL